jgi:hypothetical protein
VKDADQLALWGALLTGTNPRLGRPVLLRRHERRSLHGWAQLGGIFHTEGRLDRLPS